VGKGIKKIHVKITFHKKGWDRKLKTRLLKSRPPTEVSAFVTKDRIVMEQEMEVLPNNEMVKSRRSMSIHSICDPLASSISTLSDHDSEATLHANERTSMDDDLPKYDSLSPSEEQAVRALEDLRAGNIHFSWFQDMC